MKTLTISKPTCGISLIKFDEQTVAWYFEEDKYVLTTGKNPENIDAADRDEAVEAVTNIIKKMFATV